MGDAELPPSRRGHPRRAWLLGAPLLGCALAAGVAPVTAQREPGDDGAGSKAALRLVDATPAAARAALLLPFTDAARSDWNYTPRRRDGIAWKAMTAAQREATTTLLRSALSERGLDKVRALMALEITLRELESSSSSFARPRELRAGDLRRARRGGWGWRIEGHHLSLHFSLEGDRVVATLPQFFGANPAEVPRDVPRRPANRASGCSAPRKTWRATGSAR